MKVDKIPVSFQDARGEIIDVLKNKPVEYATFITTKKGSVRGNHYHNATFQYLYVVSGKVRAVVQMPGSDPQEHVLETGEMITNVPDECHAFEFLEDSLILVLTKGPRGGDDYEKDTYRMDVPLISPR